MKNRKHKITDLDPCGQKMSFKNSQSAWSAAAAQNRESFGMVVKKPYRCKYCGDWHLTTLE